MTRPQYIHLMASTGRATDASLYTVNALFEQMDVVIRAEQRYLLAWRSGKPGLVEQISVLAAREIHDAVVRGERPTTEIVVGCTHTVLKQDANYVRGRLERFHEALVDTLIDVSHVASPRPQHEEALCRFALAPLPRFDASRLAAVCREDLPRGVLFLARFAQWPVRWYLSRQDGPAIQKAVRTFERQLRTWYELQKILLMRAYRLAIRDVHHSPDLLD